MTETLRSALPPGRPDEPLYTCNVLSYEVGELIKCLIYSRHRQENEDDRGHRAYTVLGRIALADALTQCRLLAEEMAWDFEELLVDGKERFLERMSEIRIGIIG